MAQRSLTACCLALLFSAYACGTEGDEQINIRVINADTVTFSGVMVWTQSGHHSYGDVGAGEPSDYRPFSAAYTAPDLITAMVEGRELRYQLLDDIGAVNLEPGFFAYEVRIAPGGNTLAVRLVDEN